MLVLAMQVLKGRMGTSATNAPELQPRRRDLTRARLEPGRERPSPEGDGSTPSKRNRGTHRSSNVVASTTDSEELEPAGSNVDQRVHQLGFLPRVWRVLLRKEVIQPHLPVRLPCYDFTPIADPTFDSSLPRVGPLASGVADFRGVTGGVYKARERIHPGVADPGLLATPTSWSRVADSNPN